MFNSLCLSQVSNFITMLYTQQEAVWPRSQATWRSATQACVLQWNQQHATWNYNCWDVCVSHFFILSIIYHHCLSIFCVCVYFLYQDDLHKWIFIKQFSLITNIKEVQCQNESCLVFVLLCDGLKTYPGCTLLPHGHWRWAPGPPPCSCIPFKLSRYRQWMGEWSHWILFKGTGLK